MKPKPHVPKEDLILIKQLCRKRKWGAKRLIAEFPNKNWSLTTVTTREKNEILRMKVHLPKGKQKHP